MAAAITAPEALVLAAAVSGILVVANTVIGGRQQDRKLAASVGVPNGKGNVVQMLERVLIVQSEQSERISKISEQRENDKNDLREEITAVRTDVTSELRVVREAIDRITTKENAS